ncbi:hypothetical protein KFU94_37590 [Chloroflexi bacterium TSY]|nr:hypothetical protein [Chloroflexi bacterium TSY]
MRILAILNHLLVTILGVVTGLVKVFGLEADIEIFANLGFSYGATVAFGIIQIVAALMLLHPKTLQPGAVILGISFIIATIGLFVTGLIPFGIVSLLFIAMAGFVATRNYFDRDGG